MPRELSITVSDEVWSALSEAHERTGESIDGIVETSLCETLGVARHSIFQVSTSGALVEGVFSGATTVEDLLGHGDFGLGTFDGLDGELILVDGVCLRARAEGEISVPSGTATVPFAVVTRFSPDFTMTLPPVSTLESLQSAIDDQRPSENVFVGIRIRGTARRIDLRAACPARPGEGLVAATRHQSEYGATDVEGTLVGFWTPAFAQAINIPGYHFHWVSADRTRGGHVLEIEADATTVELHFETDVHVAIPTTEEFLRADLAGDPSSALEIAESAIDREEHGTDRS